MKTKWLCCSLLCTVFASTLLSLSLFAANSTEGPSKKKIIPPPLKDLGKPYKVRLVYFVPTDKEAKPNYRQKAEVLMRVVADVYRREMKANGQKTRGLDFEFDENAESLG